METTEPAMTSGLKHIIMWMETKLSLLHPSNTKSDTDKQIEVQEPTFISSLGGGGRGLDSSERPQIHNIPATVTLVLGIQDQTMAHHCD